MSARRFARFLCLEVVLVPATTAVHKWLAHTLDDVKVPSNHVICTVSRAGKLYTQFAVEFFDGTIIRKGIWNTVKENTLRNIPPNSTKFPQILRNSTKFNKILRNSTKYHEIQLEQLTLDLDLHHGLSHRETIVRFTLVLATIPKPHLWNMEPVLSRNHPVREPGKGHIVPRDYDGLAVKRTRDFSWLVHVNRLSFLVICTDTQLHAVWRKKNKKTERI